MPSPNAVFTELVATTFRNHAAEIVDNISGHNAFYRRMKEKGNTNKKDGGLSITAPIEYANNNTYQRYSGYDVLNVGASDVITAVDFPWRQIAINVVASGLETRVNAGKSEIVSLAKARIKNATRTFANEFSFDLYSDGSLPNQINGLQALLSDTGVGTVGGVDANAWSFWRNKVQLASAPMHGGAALTLNSANIEELMRQLYMETTRGNDQVDLILASNDLYSMFEASQLSLKRYTDKDDVSAGFMSVKYKKADVVFDGNSGMPAQRMFFLNTNYLQLIVHSEANMTRLDEAKPYNQDASVIPFIWMGNMIVTNRALQGILKP